MKNSRDTIPEGRWQVGQRKETVPRNKQCTETAKGRGVFEKQRLSQSKIKKISRTKARLIERKS